MTALALKITDAGEAAIQGASGSDAVVISHLGLTATPFDYAPTLTVLPGEFKRLDVTSGEASAPNITHLTVYDTSTDTWSATGMGLFLSDGTLFAVYVDDAAFLNKSSLAFAMLAFDILFASDIAGNIAYGNATFIYPPATETTRGIARISTQAETDAAQDDLSFVTPKKLGVRLAALLSPITQSLSNAWNAITAEANARATADGGLSGRIDAEAAARATADGTLSGRIDAEATARAAADNALMSGFACDLSKPGYQKLPSGYIEMWCTGASLQNVETTQVVTYPFEFPNAVLSVQLTVRTASFSQENDMWYQLVGDPGLASLTIARARSDSESDGPAYCLVRVIGK